MDDYELAASLVRDAGRLAAHMRRDGVTAEFKTSVSDIVTAADRAAEELVVSRLRAQRPDDAIVGEEGTADAGTGRTWYVDPVDGTYNFAAGLPEWCAAIALDDEIGSIYQPTANELWLGGRDHATTCNGVPIPPLPDHPLRRVSLATYLHPTTLPDDSVRVPLLRVMSAAATVRMLGSGSVELAAVAAGRLGAYVQVGSLPWDWLPGATIVRAAGGAAEVVESGRRRWHVAGSRRVVDEVRQLITGA